MDQEQTYYTLYHTTGIRRIGSQYSSSSESWVATLNGAWPWRRLSICILFYAPRYLANESFYLKQGIKYHTFIQPLWLVVSTPLENISLSQLGLLLPVPIHVPNHQPEIVKVHSKVRVSHVKTLPPVGVPRWGGLTKHRQSLLRRTPAQRQVADPSIYLGLRIRRLQMTWSCSEWDRLTIQMTWSCCELGRFFWIFMGCSVDWSMR